MKTPQEAIARQAVDGATPLQRPPGAAPGGSLGEKDGMTRRDPVFVVGGARSGTTFLAKLLDSHPDVLYRHEPDSILVDASIPFIPRSDQVAKHVSAAEDYLDSLCQVHTAKVSGQRPFFDKNYRSHLRKMQFLVSLYLAKGIEKGGQSLIRKPLNVSDCIGAGELEHIVYLIKSVNSPWRTKLFSEAKPHWRFIHILRHPCAVINSRLRGIESKLMQAKAYLRPAFQAGMAEGYPFSLEELEASSFEEQSVFLWMICNQRILDDMAGKAGYRLVVYEELCRNLEGNTRQLLDFAGLSWSAQTERFIRQLEATETGKAGYFDVRRAPLDSLDKWRDQLSPEQIAKIERIVCHAEVGRRFFEAG